MDRFETVKAEISRRLREKGRLLVAIDGKCTSGKTTLAARLGEAFDCNVLHMDDFFLRPEQRTAARYAEAGGNVDYERFWEEVLLPLSRQESFSYRPFDCKTLRCKAPVFLQDKPLTIIEGSYSMHPYFRDPYDLKILLTVDESTQRQRIGNRPPHLQQRFLNEWIPMENRYLETFAIAQKAHMIL